MSLTPPPKVRKLQEALHAKAKRSPGYRFYALYDKVYRRDILAHAYARCRANGGVAGVEGQEFADIEAYGLDRWLDEVAEQLRKQTYRPLPVRRVSIPKPDGKTRPLGIPTVQDRVVQMATVLVLAPIFEADLQPEQYAYREHRSALDAVLEVKALVKSGHTEVVDADLSGYFDTIPHAGLMKSVARRISDRLVLSLVAMWLESPVEETDTRGRPHRTTRARDEKRGTPQGAPISPLLANLYMRRFVLGWKTLGHERRLGARIVNYADDFVICCRGTACEAMTAMRGMMSKLKLTVNEAKTRRCRVPEDRFDFLGYTVGRWHSPRTGGAYIGVRPSSKSVVRLCREISEMTGRSQCWLDAEEMVRRLNRKLLGWSNYFCLGSSRAARVVDSHTCDRLRHWLARKHQEQGWRNSRFPEKLLYQELGLIQLQRVPRRVS